MRRNLLNAAPLGIETLKRFVNEIVPPGPVERTVSTNIALARVRQSEDLKEGIAALQEKRAPRFKGRSFGEGEARPGRIRLAGLGGAILLAVPLGIPQQ